MTSCRPRDRTAGYRTCTWPSLEHLMAKTESRLPELSARQGSATFMSYDMLTGGAVDVYQRPWAERRRLLQGLHELSPATEVWRVSAAFAGGPSLLAGTAGTGWR